MIIKLAGSIWIDGTDFHFTDALGYEYMFTGVFVSTPGGGAKEGSVWIEGNELRYIDGAGNLRKYTGVVYTPATGGIPGSLYIDLHNPFWVVPTSTDLYKGHSDTPHSDSPGHTDTPHVNIAHTDSHGDSEHTDHHRDWEHGDAHDDTHSDAHSDHHDVNPPFIPPDYHTDFYTDDHSDGDHSDFGHGDDYNDVAHSDTAHSDVTAHSDHADTVGVHSDVSHSDTPVLIDYYGINIYDPSYSSLLNYGTALADHVIEYSNIQITFAACLAGAIASLKLDGHEMIASGGHGSAFQFDCHPTSPSPGSECFNPTEAGSSGDDRRDLNGLPAQPNSSYPLLSGQFHGPSTSQVTIDPTFWKSGLLSNGQKYFRSKVRLAYYIPGYDAYTGFGGCVPSYPVDGFGENGLSQYVLDKEVRLGQWKDSGGSLIYGGYPFIGFRMTLNVGAGEPARADFNGVLIAYLLKDFHIAVPTTDCVMYDSTVERALGFKADAQTGLGTPVGSPFLFAQENDADPANPAHTTQVTWFCSTMNPPGTITYKIYCVVGSLANVRACILQIAAHTPTWI
jgi:hypothetical protein